MKQGSFLGGILQLCVRAEAKQLAEGHTEALVLIMVDPAFHFDPLGVPLQQVQDKRSKVPCYQERVVLFQHELGQTRQDGLTVLLTPYLQTETGQ